jgi:hypothetical protein
MVHILAYLEMRMCGARKVNVKISRQILWHRHVMANTSLGARSRDLDIDTLVNADRSIEAAGEEAETGASSSRQ